MTELAFNWKHPLYTPVIKARFERLRRIRADPDRYVPALKRVYRDKPWLFLSDWGTTFDPRNVRHGLPAAVPFLLFPKQAQWCEWVIERWRAGEPGVTPKSRDVGVSWLFVSLMCTCCIFYEGFAAGVGSRKEEYVDKIGSPKSLFWKARKFLEFIPPEFRAGHVAGKHDPHMRLLFPATGSSFTGEAGDNIGRGDRASIYGVDEAAYIERPMLVEASLSATTDCRIDISSANGMGNPFAEKVHSYPTKLVFTLHWRDDPRKDDAWYAKQCALLDPVTVAQEIDINFAASIEGVIIPSAHVQAAIDAHIALGIEPSGERRAAQDIADGGRDNSAFASAFGVLVDRVEEWSGRGDDDDLAKSLVRAFGYCDELGIDELIYDADGMGAHVKGDARLFNQMRREVAEREHRPPRTITPVAFWGSGEVWAPDAKIEAGADRTNLDYYMNFKAQCWGFLQRRFRETWRARNDPDYRYDPTLIISLSKDLPLLTKLVGELSQPTWGPNIIGKMVVNKKPDEDGRKAKSPNLADAIMMLMGNPRRRMRINPEAVRRA